MTPTVNPFEAQCRCGSRTWRVTGSTVRCDACGRVGKANGSTMPPTLHPPALTLNERQRAVHLLRNLAAPLALIAHQIEPDVDGAIVADLDDIVRQLVRVAEELEGGALLGDPVAVSK